VLVLGISYSDVSCPDYGKQTRENVNEAPIATKLIKAKRVPSRSAKRVSLTHVA
jgi:hypothetical protein